MRLKAWIRRRSRAALAAEQSKRRAQQRRIKARLRRSKSSGGRQKDKKGSHVNAGPRVEAPIQKGERARHREGVGSQFLVDKETKLPIIQIAVDGSDIGEPPVASHLFDVDALETFLVRAPIDEALRFVRDVLKKELMATGSRFVAFQHSILEMIYTVSITIDRADTRRRSAILKELGIKPNTKRIFLDFCNLAIPVPLIVQLDNATRKMAQNRNSDYGRAMRGAEILGIKPEEFAFRLKLAGGIQALADVARQADRRDRQKIAGEAARVSTPFRSSSDRNDGAAPPKRVSGRTWNQATNVEWERHMPAEDHFEEWTMRLSGQHSQRMADYAKPMVALLYPDRGGFNESAYLVAVQELPFAVGEHADDILYDLLHEMRIRYG